MPKMTKVKIRNNPLNTECPICLSTPQEPIKLPCNHIICLICFKRNIELTSLHCPLCKHRLSTWSRRISRNGGPKVDPGVKKWLLTQKSKTTTRRRRRRVSHNLSSSSSDSIKKDFDQEILNFRNKENTSHEKESPAELASLFSTDIEEQKRIEERLLREKEDERVALALSNSFRGIVDRSKNSPDPYSLRSKRNV